jgi:hypothetical protein
LKRGECFVALRISAEVCGTEGRDDEKAAVAEVPEYEI